MKNTRMMILLMMLALAAFSLSGCGDDDPTGPGGGNNNTGDAFDQTTAVTQAQTASPQAVAMVQSLEGMTAGVGNKNYAYNAANQRWEYDYSWGTSGYTYDWFYTVQYLDGAGNPQESHTGAVSIRHTLMGTGDYNMDQGGYVFDYDFSYSYDVTMSGLDTSTATMTGSGSTDIDYTYTGQGVNQSNNWVMNWSTLDPGISYPDGGCPTGTIRYDMSPFHLDVVFNGTGNATSTLYDGSNNVVQSGGGTYPLSCGMGR